jgi:3-oxoacyl-[acyl-carrier-protein] synthase II
MLDLPLYIQSAGFIAPAAAVDEPVVKLLCAEPDYTGFITPMQLRRMSKAVRLGIGASRDCMVQAGILKPDAISIGTAMGCLQDTEFFLSKMTAQEEKMLTPTAFIQSTHNTVGGQIALLCGCHGHNMTYVHRGHSFEHAIINTRLYLDDHPGERVLAGGIDELTDSSHLLMQRAGVYTTEPVAPASIKDQQLPGAIAGEGAAFFLLDDQAGDSKLKIRNLQLLVTTDHDLALDALQQFIAAAGLTPADIDLVLSGNNGTENAHAFYKAVSSQLFPTTPQAIFKQQCGEYATASAYGLALLWQGVTSGSFPASFFIHSQPQQLQHMLMVNHYLDHYSFWLLEAV